MYHLGNPGEEFSIGTLAHRMAAMVGREIRLVPGELPKGSPTRRCPDIGKLAALGWMTRVQLHEGLEPTLGWYSENRRLVAA